ncbi:MAG: EAL domain-containing protein, partial [Actinomycetota bacterium]|nr:EAL domain-containing protein [Actinomycetota bacterium]
MVRPLGLAPAVRRRLPGGRSRTTPQSVPALIAALAALAAGLTWWGNGFRTPFAGADPILVAGLTVALAAAGYFHVEYRHGEDDVNALDLFEAALAPALLLLPGTGVLVAVVIGRAASEALLRVRPLKAAFNVAAWAAAAAVGSSVLRLLSESPAGRAGDVSDLVALGVAMLAATLVNQVAFVFVLRLTGRRTFADVLSELRPAIVPAWVVGGVVILTFGVLFAAACSWAPALAWVLPAPLAALYWASQGYAASRAALARTSLLHRAARDLAASPGAEGAIPTFLAQVRDAFQASAIHLVAEADGVVAMEASAAAAGTTACGGRAACELGEAIAAVRRPDRVTVLSPDPRIASGLRIQGWRDGLVVPVPGIDSTRRVLCVFDPKGVVSSGDGELAVVEGLAAELGAALVRAEVEAGLRRSEARFRTLVQEASDMVVVIDGSWVVTDVLPSPAGSPIRTSPGERITLGAHPDDVPGMVRCLSHLTDRPGETGSFTWRALGTEGSWRHLETMATNLLDDAAVGGVVLISRDVTERVLATELAAGQAEALGRISRRRPLSETVASLTRATEAQTPGARLTVVLFGVDAAADSLHGARLPTSVLDGITASLWPESPRGTGEMQRSMAVGDVVAAPGWSDLVIDGEVRALWAAPITRADGSDALGVAVVHLDHPRHPDEADMRVLHSVADLTHIAVEAGTAEARLVHQASHDPLTGLPNRILFLDRTAVAMSRLARSTRTVAVIFVDLDRFKTVNDSLGHEVGDRLLIALAQRLEGAMRPSDTVARFGGDEFTILCEDIPDQHEAALIATRVRDALATPVHLEGHDLYVTASIGIAHTSDHSRAPHELVEEADAAMYEAKSAGGDVHRVYDEAVRSRAMLDLVTYQALREAISGNELRLHYQPTIDLATGRVVGVEALVRWDHPRLGLLGPDQFIPFAEATGLIVPIGALVLSEACAQRHRWTGRADPGFTVAVNLSARQFADPDLVSTVTTALEESGASPAGLILEITETALMEHAEVTMLTLRTLHDLGVRIVIDDFGTGYSSLSYLKRFPVDALKIDRSFVAGLG